MSAAPLALELRLRLHLKKVEMVKKLQMGFGGGVAVGVRTCREGVAGSFWRGENPMITSGEVAR